MNLPAQIYGDKKIIRTSDGSFTFYSMGYQESYKTKSVGAYTESLHKFVNGSNIINMLKQKDIRLLDICFGIGMNLAATIDKMIACQCENKLHAVSVELDYSLPILVSDVMALFPSTGYKILREAIVKGKCGNFSLELHLKNALEFIDQLKGHFDVIYFDPFSKKHNPEMWTEEIFQKMYNLLDKNGRLVTYASSKVIKSAMVEVGFKLTEVPSLGSRYQPSLYAEK
ncbi:MAG: hypothetical protein IJD28_02670 [Deferribacterales bacterium]|nr:hypothetical protein [Deferribacterales bacterium]